MRPPDRAGRRAGAGRGRRRQPAGGADACRAYGKRCRWDGGEVHNVRFSLDLVNHLDYIHPSSQGQATLAEVTWPGRITW